MLVACSVKLCLLETFSRAIRTSCQGISGTVNVMKGLEEGDKRDVASYIELLLIISSNLARIVPVLNWLNIDNYLGNLELLTRSDMSHCKSSCC